jgi:undecaprenyl-diphosphatase
MMAVEERLFRFLNGLSGQIPWLDRFMSTISEPYTWILVGVILFLMAFRSKDKRLMQTIIGALLALAVADLLSFEVIKPIVARERPCWMLAHVNMVLGKCGGSYGFTSNHAANAFAVWAVLANNFGVKSPSSALGLTLATTVCISRVYLGLHFVGDVIGGAVLGVVTAAALIALGLNSFTRRVTHKVIDR